MDSQQPISEIMDAPIGVVNAMIAIMGDRARKQQQRI